MQFDATHTPVRRSNRRIRADHGISNKYDGAWSTHRTTYGATGFESPLQNFVGLGDDESSNHGIGSGNGRNDVARFGCKEMAFRGQVDE